MGARAHMAPRLMQIMPDHIHFGYIGRPERASPGEGYPGGARGRAVAHHPHRSRLVRTGFAVSAQDSGRALKDTRLAAPIAEWPGKRVIRRSSHQVTSLEAYPHRSGYGVPELWAQREIRISPLPPGIPFDYAGGDRGRAGDRAAAGGTATRVHPAHLGVADAQRECESGCAAGFRLRSSIRWCPKTRRTGRTCSRAPTTCRPTSRRRCSGRRSRSRSPTVDSPSGRGRGSTCASTATTAGRGRSWRRCGARIGRLTRQREAQSQRCRIGRVDADLAKAERRRTAAAPARCPRTRTGRRAVRPSASLPRARAS